MIVPFAELTAAAAAARPTPYRAFLAHRARERFSHVALAVANLGSGLLDARAAYSVKTNPERAYLMLARDCGMLAETIGPEELALALDCGFARSELIYNGPFALEAGFGRPRYAFADSPSAFRRYVHGRLAEIPGARLRPPGINSRFGIRFDELDALCAIIGEAGAAEFALSFHVRSEDIGSRGWFDVLDAVLHAGHDIEQRTGANVVALDVGGGRDPDAFDRWLASELQPAIPRVRALLPNARQLLLEPGQEVATPCECLVTTVLEDRPQRSPHEIVVDATIGQLSHIDSYRHPAFVWSNGMLRELVRGEDRVLGAACLENDVLLEDVALPDLTAGDRIVIADCGSYDASMTSSFAGARVTPVRPRLHDVTSA